MGSNLNPDTVTKLVGQSINYLSYRNRSTQELTNYLFKKTGKNHELTAAVIEKISQFNLLNDSEFTYTLIETRLRQGRGPLMITSELRRRGIDKVLIDNEIEKITPAQWVESASNLLFRKHLDSDNVRTPRVKAKIYRYLSNRGFLSGTIYSVIDGMGGQ